MNRLRIAVCSLLVILGLTAVAVALALVTDYRPAKDAMEAARAHARARGHRVSEGGFADFVTQPDPGGGCEVECIFSTEDRGEVTVRVRRSWVLGAWRVTEFTARDAQP